MKKTLQSTYARLGAGAATLALFAAAPASALAQSFSTDSKIGPSGDANFTGTGSGNLGDSIASIATRVLEIFLLIIGILSVFYLIYSGYLYITSAGNAEKTKQARQGIINAIIGIVIVVAAFFIIRFAIGIGREVSNTNTGI